MPPSLAVTCWISVPFSTPRSRSSSSNWTPCALLTTCTAPIVRPRSDLGVVLPGGDQLLQPAVAEQPERLVQGQPAGRALARLIAQPQGLLVAKHHQHRAVELPVGSLWLGGLFSFASFENDSSFPVVTLPSGNTLDGDYTADLLMVTPTLTYRADLFTGVDGFLRGGAGPENFGEWIAASADGFGLGSALYKPGLSASEVGARARDIVSAYRAAVA